MVYNSIREGQLEVKMSIINNCTYLRMDFVSDSMLPMYNQKYRILILYPQID